MAVAAPASVPTLAECERIIMETPGGICETQYEQLPWHTGAKLWMKTFKNCYSNMREYWEDVVRKHSAREYMVYEDPYSKVEERITYGETAARVRQLANAMSKEFGVTKGDRVVLAMRNYTEFIVAFWASVSLGAIPAMANAWLVTDELSYCISLADAKVCIIDPERHERLAPRIEELRKGGVNGFVLVRADCDPKGRKASYAGTVLWEDLMKKYESGRGHLAPVDIHPDDSATILFTSGTTGRPKAALGSHRNFIANQWVAMLGAMRGAMRAGMPVPNMPLGPNDPQSVTLLVVPLFHVTAVSILGGTTLNGGKLVIAYKFEAGSALATVEKERVTGMSAVPAIIMMMLEHPDARNGKRDLSSFISAGYGGAPAHPELAVNFAKVFKGSPGTAWGMTEASPVATSISGMDYINYPDSAGIAHPLNEVIACDPDTMMEVPKGEIGELWIRGVNIIKGYWRNPEATKSAFLENGFYRTGDVGYVDKVTNYIYIKDRIKDMVGQEIEDAIFTHPAVFDCTIVGVPHRVLGEEPAAVIVPKPEFVGKVTSEDIISHLRPRIAQFKIPVFVHFREDEIPRNPNGKVQKGIFKKDIEKLWEDENAKRAGGKPKL